MCHTDCALRDAGPLTKYLKTIADWLNGNPNEVLTLLLTNPDGASPSDFAKSFDDAGLSGFAYAPPKTLALNEWPTLQELINSGKRLVMFLGLRPFAPGFGVWY
jgi:hypothetical protein